jgi:hypothetical protein
MVRNSDALGSKCDGEIGIALLLYWYRRHAWRATLRRSRVAGQRHCWSIAYRPRKQGRDRLPRLRRGKISRALWLMRFPAKTSCRSARRNILRERSPGLDRNRSANLKWRSDIADILDAESQLGPFDVSTPAIGARFWFGRDRLFTDQPLAVLVVPRLWSLRERFGREDARISQ